MTDCVVMAEVIALAREKMLAGEGGPFAALILRDGEIIARGWNRVTTINDPTAHAEIVAIRTACAHLHTFDLSGCELFVNCEPCPMCLAAAYWARLARIVYGAGQQDAADIGFDDAFIAAELTRDPGLRSLPMQQCLAGEARSGLRLWLEMDQKIPY